jgi:hypothetical protein
MPPERIFAATQREGAHFPDLIVAGRYDSPGIRHSLSSISAKWAPVAPTQ